MPWPTQCGARELITTLHQKYSSSYFLIVTLYIPPLALTTAMSQKAHFPSFCLPLILSPGFNYHLFSVSKIDSLIERFIRRLSFVSTSAWRVTSSQCSTDFSNPLPCTHKIIRAATPTSLFLSTPVIDPSHLDLKSLFSPLSSSLHSNSCSFAWLLMVAHSFPYLWTPSPQSGFTLTSSVYCNHLIDLSGSFSP